MKTTGLLLFTFFIASVMRVSAFNSNPPEKDTTKFRIKDLKIWVIDDKDTAKKDTLLAANHKKHTEKMRVWAGLDIGANGFINAEYNDFTVPAGYKYLEVDYSRSRTFSFNCLEKDIPIIKEYFQIATGLGIEYDNFKFSHNTRLFNDSGRIGGYLDTIKLSSSKLRLTYLNLPILLSFNTSNNPKNSIHFATGIILGYNIGAMTKIVYYDNGERKKDKTRGDYAINPFRYGLTTIFGIGKISTFLTYQLNTLFETDKGPELYPFSAGLSWIF